MSSLLLVFCALAYAVQAAVYTDPTAVASKPYDFVIVGSGTAGAVLASRLSENLSFKVLVIEAGGSDAGIENIEVPILAVQASPNQPYNW